jgi:putative tricarboxylic transport membrane protein
MRLTDRLIGAGAIAAGAAIFAATLRFPHLQDGAPGPALFPQILAVLMVLFGAMLGLGRDRAAAPAETPPARSDVRRARQNVALVFAAIIAFIVVAPIVGFLLTTAAILFALMWWLGSPAMRAALAAAGLTLFVYVIFGKVLRVPLPLGLLWF